MLQLLEDLPEHVVGVRATGNVTKEDIETVLIPAIDALVAKTDKINYLLILETDLSNWDFGAWVSDAKLGIQNFTKWTKIAVVSDTEISCYLIVYNFIICSCRNNSTGNDRCKSYKYLLY